MDEKEAYKDKLRSIGQVHGGSRTTTKLTRVDREDGRGIAGLQEEHWSGRVDGTALPKTVRSHLKVTEED